MTARKLFVLLLAVVFCLSLIMVAGCAQPDVAPPVDDEDVAEPEAPARKVRWTMASGWVAGVYYPLSGAMSRVAYEHMDNISLTAESSGASVANARLIGSQDAELAILQNDIAYYAKNGLQMFEGEAIPEMVGFFTLYPEHVQILAAADAGINNPGDLAGKRVAVGPLGSGTEANTAQTLEAYGLTFDDLAAVERITASEAADFLRDGRVDAAFFTVGLGAAAIEEVALVKDVVIVTIEDDKIDWLIETYPFYSREVIPAGTYSDVPEATTVAVLAMVVGHADLPEELAYQFTSMLFENLESVHSAHERGQLVTLETALDGMPIDLHPGAERYYREKGLIN
jgi:uncharacterized protein